MISKLSNRDTIDIELFGKLNSLEILITGSNKFDQNGSYKKGSFNLSDNELACLNWLISNVNISEYSDAIVSYCNDTYSEYCNKTINVNDIKSEIKITHIAINIDDDNLDDFYPDIAFYGECKCDEEHGICIGFKNRKFIGISTQDWIL